ncbi:MAG: 4-hydroxythreonine-4-phosphate dehydrogenase PdxA [Verrucomicrobiota bacterium]|nr:4-hydroxythreonine-4-phosphate dehydrogenase PdxA [Verrucomicrobiota bacterium]
MLRIGITIGDPAGIGPEIVKAALTSGQLPQANYRLIGNTDGVRAGTHSPETARAARAALEESAELAKCGEIDAVVTGPIHKANMYDIGFEFPGQTEFFAHRCGVENFAMLLTGGKLTVALVTTHIALRDVAGALRQSEIVRVGLLLAQFLRRRRGASPRIAVAGLNPHAGESGALGREEIDVIAPAVTELQTQNSATFAGPFSPDTVFYHAAAGAWDAVLCMYHDQGLIPLKLHAFHEGVNVTLGLPFPRTSPDHGTAFEIAGKGIARPDSMIAAIKLSVELARKQ